MKLIWKYTFKIILTRKIFYFYWCSKYTRIFFRSKKKKNWYHVKVMHQPHKLWKWENLFFLYKKKSTKPSTDYKVTNAQLDWNAFGVREVTAPSLPPKSSWSQYKYCLVHYSLIIALQKPNRNLPFLFRPAPASPGLSL